MLVHGLRLLVALITFAFGLAASWLLGSEGGPRPERKLVKTEEIYVFKQQAELPTRGCKSGITRAEHGEARTVEGGILNHKAQSLPAPGYPAEAKAARARGSVPVRVVVDEGGRVSSAHAFGGPKALWQAAEDAARDALFAPTLLSGRPVKVSGTINYNFSLQ